MFTMKQAHDAFSVTNSASENFTVSSSSGVFLSMVEFFETAKTLVNQLEKKLKQDNIVRSQAAMPPFAPSIILPMKSSIARAVITIGGCQGQIQ